MSPHWTLAAFEMLRLTRQGRVWRMRMLFVGLILVGLFFFFRSAADSRSPAWGGMLVALEPGEVGTLTERVLFVCFLWQLLAVLLLTPAYVAVIYPEEKEGRTLEILLATEAVPGEILQAKLYSRLGHLAALILAGVPIVCLALPFVLHDLLWVLWAYLLTFWTLWWVGHLSLALMTEADNAMEGVIKTYVILLCIVFSGLWIGMLVQGFLYDILWRMRAQTWVTISSYFMLPLIFTFACQCLAWVAMRDFRRKLPTECEKLLGAAAPPKPIPIVIPLPPAKPAVVPLDIPLPIALPAVPDKVRETTYQVWEEWPLLWKEVDWGYTTPLRQRWWQIPGRALLTFILVFGGLGLGAFLLSGQENVARPWWMIPRAAGECALAIVTLSVAIRAVVGVVRERVQGTWTDLLLLPQSRHSLLRTKLLGCFLRCSGDLVVTVAVFLVCFLEGGPSAWRFFPWLLAFLTYLLGLLALGLWLSLVCGTYRSALFWMFGAIVATNLYPPLGFWFSWWHLWNWPFNTLPGLGVEWLPWFTGLTVGYGVLAGLCRWLSWRRVVGEHGR
jgi:hypothetical protein